MAERFAAIHQQESLILEVCDSSCMAICISNISQKLHTFEAHLENSEARATKLLETQLHHAKAIETQAKAQEVLGSNTKIVHALLEKLAERAANLEVMLEEAAYKFKGLQEMDSVFGVNMSLWTVISLLITILIVQNPRMAGILSIFAGFALLSRAVSYFTPFHLSSLLNRL